MQLGQGGVLVHCGRWEMEKLPKLKTPSSFDTWGVFENTTDY
jgi:hypothetical protein